MSEESNDRRRQPRMEQYFACTWTSDWGEERSRINSLSTTGCFIETRAALPPEGAALALVIETLPGRTIALQGTVVNPMRGVGFAVEFSDVDEDVSQTLSALVQR